MKIKEKFSLLIMGLIVISMLTFGVSATLAIQSNLTDEVVQGKLMNDKKVVDEFIKYTLQRYNDIEFTRRSIEISHKLKDMLGLRVSLYNNNILLADSSDMQEEMPYLVQNYALNGEISYTKDDEYLYFAFPLEKLGAARLAYPLESINKIILRTQISIFYTGLIILMIFLLAANYFAKLFSQPIIQLNNQIKKVRDGDYLINMQHGSRDEIGELVLSFTDMANKIHNNIEQLNQMVENEKHMKELQRSFMNNVTHEFKTPLTSIIGYSDLLNQYNDDPVLLENAARTIKSEGERLLLMVEKLLYLSSLEHVGLVAKYEEFCIDDLLNDCIAAIRLKAENNSLKLIKDTACEGVICGDYEELYSMLINVLDNAIKYNKQGGIIAIEAALEDDWLKLVVTDTGIGIPLEDLAKVYEPFYRVDKNRSRKIGGNGLGLAIVKEIVNLHKGSINIESKKDVGTSIKILLPRRLSYGATECGY